MSFAAVVIYYVRLPKLIERMTFLSDILHLRYEKRSIAKASSSVVDSRFESNRSIQMDQSHQWIWKNGESLKFIAEVMLRKLISVIDHKHWIFIGKHFVFEVCAKLSMSLQRLFTFFSRI